VKHIRNLEKDIILKKRLQVARNHDKSFFDDSGNLLMHEEDSFEENNFFQVLSVTGTQITVKKGSAEGQTPRSQTSDWTASTLTKVVRTSVQIIE